MPHTNEEMMRRIDNKSQNEEWGAWRFVSDMLDNPDEFDIYPTSKCYEQIYDFVVSQKKKALSDLKKSIREETAKEKEHWEKHSAGNYKFGATEALNKILSIKPLE